MPPANSGADRSKLITKPMKLSLQLPMPVTETGCGPVTVKSLGTTEVQRMGLRKTNCNLFVAQGKVAILSIGVAAEGATLNWILLRGLIGLLQLSSKVFPSI